MKKIFAPLVDYVNSLILDKHKPQPIKIHPRRDINKILDQAVAQKSAVHVIYLDRHFTGDIVKFDRQKKQLILKNFKRTMTTIIALDDIKKVSILPNSIQITQESSKKSRA